MANEGTYYSYEGLARIMNSKSVIMNHNTFTNIFTLNVGIVYLQNVIYFEDSNSLFLYCTALNGGAMLIQNSVGTL